MLWNEPKNPSMTREKIRRPIPYGESPSDDGAEESLEDDDMREKLKIVIPSVMSTAPVHSLRSYDLRSTMRPMSMVGISFEDLARVAVGYET
mmetsp:Transcript_16392/g.20444  ORF Transcript_16392/g.20444 Transcript_16392/m.20444 type:complete len:92 (-) Transcript_16392:596-871(-)